MLVADLFDRLAVCVPARAVGLAVLALVALAPAGAVAAQAPLRNAGRRDAVPGRYIVVLKAGTTRAAADRAVRATRDRGGRVGHRYAHALRGYSASLSAGELAAARRDPSVAYVEPDGIVTTDRTQSGATWGLDRIDQRNLPLSTTYSYDYTGAGVKAYVIDTGIRVSHTDFGGRATSGVDVVDGALPADDCNGHGTHVAGTLGGSTYGVAKQVSLVAVRVIGCNGAGDDSDVIAGVDWVTGDHQAGQAAVANMSLGAAGSTAVDEAVSASIADGVTYVIAAGNNDDDACARSPGRVASAITVGATDATDARASFSNHGTCLDLFAPGTGVTSDWKGSDSDTNTISGTSMAAPHVAGVAALYLQRFGSAVPATVTAALLDGATTGKVTNPSGSPNRLLYSPITGPSSVTAAASPDFTLGTPGTLTASAVARGATPVTTGKLGLRLFGPNDATCAGPPVFAPAAVSYPATGATVDAGPFTPTMAGTYRWVAGYHWSQSLLAGACNDPGSTTVVARATPAVEADAVPAAAATGSPLRAMAIVTGRVNPQDGATMTFDLYGPQDPACAKAPIFRAADAPVSTTAGALASPAYTPAQAGTYHWRAVYGGEANNQPATSPCTAAPVSVTAALSFGDAPKHIRVSRKGRFAYRFGLAPGTHGTLSLTSVRKVRSGGHAHHLKLGARSFGSASGGHVTLRLRLSSQSLAALKHRGSVRFRVKAVVGAKTFSTTLTLEAPKP